MIIAFDIPHAFHGASDSLSDARCLRTLLDCLIRLNLAYLRSHANIPSLYRSGVVYGRTKVWDTIPALYQRGYGDCKSLSAAYVAEKLHKGEKARAVFRWVKRRDGGKDFHILVQTERGYEDPSKVLGMGSNENAHFARQT